MRDDARHWDEYLWKTQKADIWTVGLDNKLAVNELRCHIVEGTVLRRARASTTR